MTTTAAKYWTDAELLALPKDGFKREIVNGKMVMMSPANFRHGKFIGRITVPLGEAIFRAGLGELADGQTGFRVTSGDLFCPDIAFVAKDRVAEHEKKGSTFFEGAPDLAVEVVSPSDTIGALEEKLAQFFAGGMRLAWIVHRRTRTVHVYRSPAQQKILTESDHLDGDEVVPGFRLAVAAIFQQG